MPAIFTLNAPDAATGNRIVDALCAVNGYQATLPDPANPSQTIPNPETKAQFAKRQVIEYLRSTVVAYERSQLAAPAAPAVT